MTTIRTKARITGFFYLLTIVGGVFAGGYVGERLIVSGDAARTAANIMANQGLWYTGFAVFIIEMACQVVLTALFYHLLKPAGRSVSLVAAFLGLTGAVIKMFARVFFIAPVLVLGDAAYLRVFSVEQKQALAMLLLKVNGQGAAIALVFLGAYAVLCGYLMLRSTFLPRVFGAISVVAGLGWMTFLYPPLGARLFTVVAIVALLGCGALIAWLLIFGVNEQRWREQAAAAGTE